MGILATIQSYANVNSSRTYVTNQLLLEEDIAQVRNEMSLSKGGKYSRSLGAFIEEKNCSLEKAKSLAIKCSLNKLKGTKTFTIFANTQTAEDILKEHPNAVIAPTVNECLQKANNDI